MAKITYEVTKEIIELAIQGLDILSKHVAEGRAQLTRIIEGPTEHGPDMMVEISESGKELLDAVDTKAVHRAARKAGYTPEKRRQMSERTKALWADPKYKARVLRSRRRTLRLKQQGQA